MPTITSAERRQLAQEIAEMENAATADRLLGVVLLRLETIEEKLDKLIRTVPRRGF